MTGEPRKAAHSTPAAAVQTPPAHAPHVAGAAFWTAALGSVGVVFGDIGTSPLYMPFGWPCSRPRLRASISMR